MNDQNGSKAIQEIEEQFGRNKAVFILTDVRSLDSFEGSFPIWFSKILFYFQLQLLGAFTKTVETFKTVDILVNNAGILDDSQWNNEIEINLVSRL